MSDVWNDIEPFFRANGSFGFTPEKYAGDIAATESVCKELGVSIPYYLQGVFYPRLSEQLTNFRVRPKHLHGDWAIQKFRDWVRLGEGATPGTMEAQYIRNSHAYVRATGMTEEEYFAGGMLIPPCLEDLRKRKISIAYAAANPYFKQAYKSFPPDIIAEYFDGIDVLWIGTQIKLNMHIQEALNE